MFDILYSQENGMDTAIGDAPDGCCTINVGFIACVGIIIGKRQAEKI